MPDDTNKDATKTVAKPGEKKVQKWRIDKNEPPLELVLPKSGCLAKIHPSKGDTSVKVQRMAGTDDASYMPALMALLVTIDDEKLTPEDFLEMNGPDYMAIQAELAKSNFM